MTLEQTLPATSDAPALARAAVEPLAAALEHPVGCDLRLLVSELVTNAVRHGSAPPGGEVGLTAVKRDGHVHVEVSEPGPGLAKPDRAPSPGGARGGWGLFLVDRLAVDWGTRTGTPSCVWFDLAVS